MGGRGNSSIFGNLTPADHYSDYNFMRTEREGGEVRWQTGKQLLLCWGGKDPRPGWGKGSIGAKMDAWPPLRPPVWPQVSQFSVLSLGPLHHETCNGI